MDPFQLSTYQLSLHEVGQLTSDELRITLKETVPLMKAVLDAENVPEEQTPPAQY